MALTINKPGAAPKAAAKTKTSPKSSMKASLGAEEGASVINQPVTTDVVDEFLALDAKLKKHAAKVADDQARYDELKKQIVALVDETTDAEKDVVLVGAEQTGKIEVSEKTMQTTLTDIDAAKKFMGKDTFFKVAKIGVGDLKDYLTPEQREQCTKTERSGSRRLKIK